VEGRGVEAKSIWEGIRDWAAFAFGATAFVVSLVAAYVTTFRVVDELRVVPIREPTIGLRGMDNVTVSVKGPLSLLFINSGTRPISILGVSLVVGEVKQKGCDFESGLELKGKFDGMVIEAQKIASSNVSLELPVWSSVPAWSEVTQVDGNTISLKWGKRQPIVSCLMVTLATISRWPFRRYEYLSSTTITLMAPEPEVERRDTPITLHTESRTIFSSD
jgi:hypothetical protein